MSFLRPLLATLLLGSSFGSAQEPETLPPLNDGQAPSNFDEMWAGFDPRAEPLEVETLKEWEEDGVALRVVRFRIGVFKGQKATIAAVYGFPRSARESGDKLPGLVQIHGGGQYADHKACLANGKRGYATVSIAWAGRISAPGYQVSPAEVQLFWDGKTDDPNYRVTTDWGAVDGYHAPGRNADNQFPSAKPAAWTLDNVESPRNSGWFLCAVAARRALTFLEQQPEVDSERLGVYGHSMGGKLTVMTSVDPRVKAAAPSCGGISDRYNKSPLFNATIGDDVSLKQITCPIFFLSPANDFHGRIGNLPDAIAEIQSKDWRVTCSPHHNHQDTAEYEVATLLWFDQHLKGSFRVPRTPQTSLQLDTVDGTPVFTVRPQAKPVVSVDVYYTLQGKADERPEDRLDTMHRFWHHATATKTGGGWIAPLPLSRTDKPLWVYANVRYSLNQPVSGVGYYYGGYTATSYSLSSLLHAVTPDELAEADAKATLKPSRLIEDFSGDWEKEWFTYRPAEWARTTHKFNSELWQAPNDAVLALEVQAEESNKLVVLLDDYAAEVALSGGDDWQEIRLKPGDFQNAAGDPLEYWDGVRRLKLSPAEHLRPARGSTAKPRLVGANWRGAAPSFRSLRWHVHSESGDGE
ncbi:MAG: dienelactone hydrolase family protein [Planctomycetota bacterium]|jgi:dienelactone hydrolase